LSREFSTIEPGTIASSSLRAAVSASERRRQFGDERILAIVREGEAGQRVADLCEAHGISAQMYYLWKARYGGMDLADMQRMRQRARTVRAAATTAAAAVLFAAGLLVGRLALTTGPATSPASAASPVIQPIPETPGLDPPAPAAAVEETSGPAGGGAPGDEGPIVSGRTPADAADAPPPLVEAPDADTVAPTSASPSSALPEQEAETGYAVQVAAFPDGRQAEALVQQLTEKGYPTYILNKAGPSPVLRVRVGPFKTRGEAEAAAAKLAAEEQVKPWITR
jgi:putative transposase